MPDKELSLNEICNAINSSSTKNISNSVGQIVQKVFPNLKVMRKRCKSDWTKRQMIYQGIFWQTDGKKIDFNDISKLSRDFFVLNETQDSIKLGHMLKVMINSNRVVIELLFQNNLKWFISIRDQQRLKPSQFGMSDTFVLEENYLLGILDGIRTLRMCKGVTDISPQNENECIKEIFTNNAENSSISVYRSLKCHHIINYRSHPSVNICSACKDFLKIKNNVLRDITNIPQFQTADHEYIRKDKSEDKKSKAKNIKLDHNDHCYNEKNVKIDKTAIAAKSKDKQGMNQNKQNSEDPSVKLGVSNRQNSESNDSESHLTLSESDNNDMHIILNEMSKGCPRKIMEFLQSQKSALSSHPNGRRWNANIIRLCLTMWCRSPKSYSDLIQSGFVVLPSQKVLQVYKNKFHQKAGLNKELLHWMKNEALHKNLPPEGYEGGLILDEMSIQSDLQFYSKNGKTYLIGFTDILDETQLMESISSGKKELCLATHVLQFVFLGFTGFRFPLFHFPTKQASASELNLLFWKITNLLQIFGFNVKYVSLDGAQTNRDFAKILLGDFHSSTVNTMRVQNIFSLIPQYTYVIMDYSHVMKKIRNNLNKSGKQSSYKRHLLNNGYFIYWEHLKSAYIWDITHNPFPIHQKLTHEHFHLSSESKMRNKLAEDVLNKDMLYLLKTYADSLGDNGSHLKGTIDLLEQTSILVQNFRDHRPISDIGDIRLEQNQKVLKWFQDWEKYILSNSEVKDKENNMISHQTRADICSLLIGFHELCTEKLKTGSASIVPDRLNSDVIENVFCQQRGLYNGNNTNPTYLNYCRTMNAIILGQETVSKKSNSGGITPEGAQPFSQYSSTSR